MRALVGAAACLAVALAGCGGVDRVDDNSAGVNEPVALTPVPGGQADPGSTASLDGANGLAPAINPDRIGAAVPIGSGNAGSGPWGAWAYRLKDGTMCLEYVGGESGGAACGPEQSMLKPTTSTSDRDGFITGGTVQPSAVGAVIRFPDGTSTKAALVTPGTVSTIGARYYVAAIPPGGKAVTVDIVDVAGNVLETTTLTTR